MKQIPIWIDCDPGTDDAAALQVAHRLPELHIVGVSAVAGNVCLEKTLRNALALREFMGAEFPVYAGAEKPWRRAPLDSSEFHGKEGLVPPRCRCRRSRRKRSRCGTRCMPPPAAMRASWSW